MQRHHDMGDLSRRLGIDALPVEYSDDDDFVRIDLLLGDGGEVLSGRGAYLACARPEEVRERVAKKLNERVSS